MRAKKAKTFRRQAKILAGDLYNWKPLYKCRKKLDKNKEAALQRLKMRGGTDEANLANFNTTSNKPMEYTKNLEQGNDVNI